MLFNSLHFLLFFPIVTFLYFRLSHKYRWILLLVASCYFYMSWKAEYILLILFVAGIDYVAALKIVGTKNQKLRKIYLAISLSSNIGILFAFKYFNFISDSVREVLAQFSIPMDPILLNIILPVGISFHTFQSMGYAIDVYRGALKPERNFWRFALFVTYFPQLVAGPIERATNLMPQLKKEQRFEYQRAADGIKLMLWGMFKKVVIADRLALAVNAVYSNPTEYTGLPLVIATVFFAFQIYCDFSGYSDIAIGASQVMGISLMDNFRRPYLAKSITDFWRRWHISLTTWFKDYVYIPLGGNRKGEPRTYFNILLVFLISGIWHGANWTFVIWGFLHGTLQTIERITSKAREGMHNFLHKIVPSILLHAFAILLTFSLVSIAWVFFRANTVQDAFYIISHMFVDLSLQTHGVNFGNIGYSGIAVAILSILFMMTVHCIQEHMSMRHFLSGKPRYIRWTIYLSITFLILLFGVFNETQFIYFQF